MSEAIKSKNKHVKVPLAGVIFFSILLAGTSFYSGTSWAKSQGLSSETSATSSNVFQVEKTERPEVKFFVMSFCPYGNNMEDILLPVANLLGEKADIRPQYIFGKIPNLKDYCAQRSGDVTQCPLYISNGYFKTEAECKETVAESLKTCLDEKNYIKASDGTLYDSLHGRVEANQNIREICAWNLVSDKKQWWSFVDNVNKNCSDQNADTCWEEQAKKANLDTNKITECFNKDAISLIEKEVAETDKYQVSGSPTVLVNGQLFPPESAYTQDGKGTLKIGKKVAEQAKYRTPNVIKEAICSAFKKAPKECDTVLNELDGQAPAAGGCN